MSNINSASEQAAKNKEIFLQMYLEIQREGADRLLDWINTTDFFTAPASTRFHGSHEGGLCEHSLNVANRLIDMVSVEYPEDITRESAIICGLLHDVCKANFYKTDTRNKKDKSGNWIQVPYYTVEDQFPFGHGEKSVFVINQFMRLSAEEAMAIRWHMGGFDDSVKGGSFGMSNAYSKYKLPVLLHTADMLATYIDEERP